jgi:hypothetical protein
VDGIALLFLVALMIGGMVCRLLAKKEQEKKEAELLERNPEAWKAVKVFELEKKDRSRRSGLDAAVILAKIFLKR